MEPFSVRDCALIVRMGGVEPAMNLRELRERIRHCPPECLYHHFCETQLRPSFDDPEYTNDFAVWASRALLDRPLAEQLGILDPYDYESIDGLKADLIEILDTRLSELSHVPWARAGQEFQFMRAATVVFDTGLDINHPSELSQAIAGMTLSSVYYHFVEARRRTEGRIDDFSAWLQAGDEWARSLAEAFGAIDFYFLTLRELQRALVRVAKEHV
jgi:hypothetical protein